MVTETNTPSEEAHTDTHTDTHTHLLSGEGAAARGEDGGERRVYKQTGAAAAAAAARSGLLEIAGERQGRGGAGAIYRDGG